MNQQPNPQLDPANRGAAAAFVKIGDDYAEQERQDAAIGLYNEAIKRNPYLADAYYRRGLVYKAWEKYHQARDEFDEALRCWTTAHLSTMTMKSRRVSWVCGINHSSIGGYFNILACCNKKLIAKNLRV